MKSSYVMFHDEKKCIGCQACTVGCANVNDVPAGFGRVQVQIKQDKDRYQFYRVSCQHCEKAPCVGVCPTGASYVDAEGIVKVNNSRCIACSYCQSACPYSVRYMDPDTCCPDKCDFCAESRLAKGELPVCVAVCPTDALSLVKADSEEAAEWIEKHPEAYRESKGGAGLASVYRRKEIH
ncbi:MAG: 4Fe-4S dicluster domain-containing protein [Geovibrio sp.]|nr:4Fe-4S dicluster domain-containing protein [Geovibrio sp.]